ncbi:putative C2H2-type zinc finger [Lyophyllum shimeji]|uniref:C2H2-type zinc finger n=1 Tax=Lyophyllum shimeji TaxID=47721 RepID=A0A9P3UNM6_LYOSH|nr:putative C2H2-type zinc finger [Lyophyllum shimeji]
MMSAQPYHALWKDPKNIFGIASPCEDCVEPLYPSTEITSQCTDQCVVIACNDPDHDQANQCHGTGDLHCDLVCEGAADCTDCDGFDEFLQCCTDYHSYFSDPRNVDQLSSNTSFSWDSSFEAFLCSCDGTGVLPPANTQAATNSTILVGQDSNIVIPAGVIFPPTPQLRTPHTTQNGPPSLSSGSVGPLSQVGLLAKIISPPTPPLPSPRATQCVASCPLGPVSNVDMPADTTVPPALRPPSPHNSHYLAPSALPSTGSGLLTCMWGNCRASFSSLPELVGHVNLEHLRLPSSPQQAGYVAPISPDVSPLACQWGNCGIHPWPGSTSSSSLGDDIEEMRKTIATHLLHDHLCMTNCDSTPANTTGNETDHSSASSQPSAETATRSASPSSSTGVHQCRWQSCKESFDTYEDLTTHITVFHVGCGKAQYECFWEGCNRNCSNGFSSKQKICRHLQSHTGHRPYQCEICQQYFSEAATLQQHMRRHTQEKPYVCDYPGCGKTFAIAGALTIHKRIHNGQKPFKCKFCDKAFSESSNLSKHLRTHTGARPYSCAEPGCNKSFARPDQLTRHLGVHRKKSPPQRDPSSPAVADGAAAVS